MTGAFNRKSANSCRRVIAFFHVLSSESIKINYLGNIDVARKHLKKRRVQLERLEARQLLAADVGLSGGILNIYGSNSADKAYVSYSGSYVKTTLNGDVEKFSKSKVDKIVFRGYKGNDYFHNSTSIKTTAYGHQGNDRIYGGSGSDYLSGGSGRDKVYGRGGNDTVRGNSGNDYLSGGSGRDKVYGHDGNDTVRGNSGNDYVSGGDGHDKVYGHSGNDTVRGNAGNDTLYGGSGNDNLQGYKGRDKMYGESGNDKMYGGDQDDKMYGGSGNDTMYGQRGHDEMFGGSGNDYMAGYTGNDEMYGESGNDTVRGNDGNDRLFGGDGVDKIVGGKGHDALYGGGKSSADKLWGESGRDRFLTQGTDKIMDGKGIKSREGEDVQIKFVNRNESWSNDEIEVVDRAFAKLFAARNDNDLLRDTYTTQPLTFYQEKMSWGGLNTSNTQKQNSCSVSGPWYNQTETCNYRTKWIRHEISLPEWNEGSSSKNKNVVSTVIHEIAHNFDDESKEFSQFKKVSGWVHRPGSKKGLHKGANFSGGKGEGKGWYRKSNKKTEFARDYGGTNPMEDFATVFELYFKQNKSTKASNAKLAAKLKIVDLVVKNA